MFSKVRTVTIALVFGVIATLGTALYINSVKAEIIESGEKKTVYMAAKPIPAGSPVVDLIDKGLVEKTDIPKQYVAEDALSDLRQHKSRVIVTALSRGEQLTSAKLRPAGQSELAVKLSKDKIALAIGVDAVTGVDGKIATGDRVVVLAMFAPGPGGSDMSRVLLKDILVLDVSEDQKRGGGVGSSIKRTITLAVSLPEAEKLVFAEEKGRVWVGLSTPVDAELPPTAGQTMESVFN